MDATQYAQLCTEISVRERHFLTGETYQQLVAAKDEAQVALLLQSTPYVLDEAALSQHTAIESALMQHLASEYAFCYQQSPEQQLVDIFALKYVYHNLKVLLKMRAVERDLSDLLIPIGPYSLDVLRHLAVTLDSDQCEALLIEEVQQTWAEYQDYQNTVAIDMGMDSAYFRHLRFIANQTDDQTVRSVIDGMIDFFNAITALRGITQAKPNSFMLRLMSRKGTIRPRMMLEYAVQQQLATWFNELNALPYQADFDPYLDKMRQGTITAGELEQLRDLYLGALVLQAQFEAISPLALLRYLYGQEMEVLNLRLILTGRANHLPMDTIIERMRPTYYGNYTV